MHMPRVGMHGTWQHAVWNFLSKMKVRLVVVMVGLTKRTNESDKIARKSSSHLIALRHNSNIFTDRKFGSFRVQNAVAQV